MTDPTVHTIWRMKVEWQSIRHSEESARAWDALEDTDAPGIAGPISDLGDLVDRLRFNSGYLNRVESAAVIRILLRCAPRHRLITRAILEALMPGFVNVARRLSWGAGGAWSDPEEFFADLVVTAWEVTADWSGQDRPYAVLDLLSAIRCRMRRQLLAHRRDQRRIAFGLEEDDSRCANSFPTPGDVDHLARAIKALPVAGSDRRDAAILYGTCVLGYTVSALATMTGLSRRQISDGRIRAAKCLVS